MIERVPRLVRAAHDTISHTEAQPALQVIGIFFEPRRELLDHGFDHGRPLFRTHLSRRVHILTARPLGGLSFGRIGVDFLDYCRKWHIKEGETSEIFRALGEEIRERDRKLRQFELLRRELEETQSNLEAVAGRQADRPRSIESMQRAAGSGSREQLVRLFTRK